LETKDPPVQKNTHSPFLLSPPSFHLVNLCDTALPGSSTWIKSLTPSGTPLSSSCPPPPVGCGDNASSPITTFPGWPSPPSPPPFPFLSSFNYFPLIRPSDTPLAVRRSHRLLPLVFLWLASVRALPTCLVLVRRIVYFFLETFLLPLRSLCFSLWHEFPVLLFCLLLSAQFHLFAFTAILRTAS